MNAANQPTCGHAVASQQWPCRSFHGGGAVPAEQLQLRVLTNGLRDLQNTPFAGTNFYFYTGSGADAAPPAVDSVAPPAGATDVGISATVRVYFSESINP